MLQAEASEWAMISIEVSCVHGHSVIITGLESLDCHVAQAGAAAMQLAADP